MVAMRNLLPIAAAVVMGFSVPVAAVAQTHAEPPPASTNAEDPFGEQVTLTEQTVVYVSGSGQWDTAY